MRFALALCGASCTYDFDAALSRLGEGGAANVSGTAATQSAQGGDGGAPPASGGGGAGGEGAGGTHATTSGGGAVLSDACREAAGLPPAATCARCAHVLSEPACSGQPLCAASAQRYEAAVQCVCEKCSTECVALCGVGQNTAYCDTCATSACGEPLETCANDQ